MHMEDLPRQRNHRAIQAGNGNHQHPVLLCHRPTKLVRRARDLSSDANVSREDGHNRCDITKSNISALRIPCSNGDRCIRNAVWNLIIKFAYF